MNKEKKNILICFCKHPEPGLVKTRLAKMLNATQASKVYITLLEQTLRSIKQTHFKTYLYCHPDVNHPLLEKYSNEYEIPLRQQSKGDLGIKMHDAIQAHLAEDTNVVLIGSDCLELDADYLSKAFKYLNSGFDIVLAPTLDNGYALIGANKINFSIFQNVCWSTTKVLEQTKENITKLEWKYKCLEEVRDLDMFEDYQYFSKHEKYKHLFNLQ